MSLIRGVDVDGGIRIRVVVNTMHVSVPASVSVALKPVTILRAIVAAAGRSATARVTVPFQLNLNSIFRRIMIKFCRVSRGRIEPLFFAGKHIGHLLNRHRLS